MPGSSAAKAMAPAPLTAVEIVTFGCRLNAFESEVIRRAAGDAGLADAVIINTCAVTAEAERQARQAIRRARREHPLARIIVTGCAATLAPERYAAVAGVDLVLDNAAKLRAESYLSDARATALSRPPPPPPPPPGGGAGRGGAPGGGRGRGARDPAPR